MLHRFREIEKCGFMPIFMKTILIVALAAILIHSAYTKSIFLFRKPLYTPILGGLNKYDIVLEVGEHYHLYVFDINKRVSFQSTDIKVATVSLLGDVSAWRPGTTIIKVRYDKKELRCRVRVVQLSKRKMQMAVGDNKNIRLKHVFFGVKYTSSDNNVVTVNRFGNVKAVGKGSALITATYKGKKLSCRVIVSDG